MGNLLGKGTGVDPDFMGTSDYDTEDSLQRNAVWGGKEGYQIPVGNHLKGPIGIDGGISGSWNGRNKRGRGYRKKIKTKNSKRKKIKTKKRKYRERERTKIK